MVKTTWVKYPGDVADDLVIEVRDLQEQRELMRSVTIDDEQMVKLLAMWDMPHPRIIFKRPTFKMATKRI